MTGRAHADLPTLRAPSLREALTKPVLGELPSDQFAAFLMKRRWFGAKAGAPREVRFRDVVPLPWEEGAFALARLEVTLGDGAKAIYSLPLAVRPVEDDDRGSSAVRHPPSEGIALISTPATTALLFDATQDPAFRRGIADSFVAGARFEADGVRWTIESSSAKPVVVPPNTEIRLGSAEQSNTSLIFDEEAILKLFRRLERGEHPDVEITRFLTLEAGFAHTPALLGIIRVEDREGTTVAGMLQEFLPRSQDAWAFALARARPYFDAPRGEDRPNDFLVEAARLGEVTRQMHDALATGRDEAFVPERATAQDVERWATRTKQWIRDGLALLERQLQAKRLPRERTGEAQALVGRRDHFLGRVDEIVDTIGDDGGERIRVHGDYHLGQVLRTASDDFMIIDFEGEPARSLAERQEKASPLRDVAGMLRSFAYAAATLGMQAKMLDVGTREVRIGRWERDVRARFLEGYVGNRGWGMGDGESGSGILPSTDANTQALLALFETEKAFYELVYELNNRPEWVWIPMRGIAKLL